MVYFLGLYLTKAGATSMKKLFSIALTFSIVLGLSVTTIADSIGFLDMARVMQSYTEAVTVQETLQAEQLDLQKKLQEKQAEINTAREEGKDEEELKKLFQKFEEELAPEREKFLRKGAESRRRLLAKVIETSKVVAKEYGIDIVVDRSAIYVGGFDLTEFVIDHLNK